MISHSHNWRRVCVNMNHILNLTHVWFRWYLDEILNFRVDATMSYDFWRYLDGASVFCMWEEQESCGIRYAPLGSSYVSSKFMYWTWIFIEEVLRGGALGSRLGQEGSMLKSGINAHGEGCVWEMWGRHGLGIGEYCLFLPPREGLARWCCL